MMKSELYDVVIIGGGPAGSTCATLLLKYLPTARVLVIERELFPRDHVGESQLPAITPILHEMGVWDKVEAAGFPIKTGAMYRWGSSNDLWRLDFLVGEAFQDNPRPEPLTGQRRQTTFHVERSRYDKILLDHAEEMGAEVRQGTKVVRVESDESSPDSVAQVHLASGETVRSKYYVDASGHAGILRRHMGVGVTEPTQLKNVAVWDYWDHPAWADGVCQGGIRARIFSLGYGWIWFLPLSRTRASVGFVTHAEYLAKSGLKPADIYAKALADEPFVWAVMEGAISERKLATTKDWSFMADRVVGNNWYLVGESAGFADPILAAGMSLAQVGARELAHVLAARLLGEHDVAWLDEWYGELTLRRISQHIRFADYWYSANAHWTDLKEYSAQIARDAGFDMDPDAGFRWLSTGGFASDSLSGPIVGSYQLGPAKFVMQRLTGRASTWQINQLNDLRLNLVGAEETTVPRFRDGKIEKIRCYKKGPKLLPIVDTYLLVIAAIQRERDAVTIASLLRAATGSPNGIYTRPMAAALDAIEGMIAEGWIIGKLNKKRPMLRVEFEGGSMAVTTEHEPFLITPPTPA